MPGLPGTNGTDGILGTDGMPGEPVRNKTIVIIVNKIVVIFENSQH